MKQVMNRSALLAWAGTATTVVLSIAPWIHEKLGGPDAAYAPEVALLAATLVVIIWYTYWTHRAVIAPSQEHERRRRLSAQAIGTALLTELQWLDRGIRSIHDGGAWSYDPLAHPLLDAAQSKIEVFSGETIQSIAALRARIDDLRGVHAPMVALGDRIHDMLENELKDHFHMVCTKAHLANEALIQLTEILRRVEGAAMPPAPTGLSVSGKSPPLKASPFPAVTYEQRGLKPTAESP